MACWPYTSAASRLIAGIPATERPAMGWQYIHSCQALYAVSLNGVRPPGMNGLDKKMHLPGVLSRVSPQLYAVCPLDECVGHIPKATWRLIACFPATIWRRTTSRWTNSSSYPASSYQGFSVDCTTCCLQVVMGWPKSCS